MSKSFADVMKSEKNGRRRVTELMCFSPTLSEEYRELGVEYMNASKRQQTVASDDPDAPRSTRRLAERSDTDKIVDKMTALVEGNPESFYDVTLEAMRPADWNKLRANHPPRDKVAADGGLYNVETFPEAALRESMVDPEPTDDALAYFADNLSNGERERLARAIWNLNEGVRSLPKTETLSRLLGGAPV